MSTNELSQQWRTAIRTDRSEINRLYRIEGWTLEQIQLYMEEKHLENGCHLSVDQWKRFLRDDLEIRKNMCEQEVLSIESCLGPDLKTGPVLIFSDGILLNVEDARKYRKRKTNSIWVRKVEHIREITFVDIPHTVQALSDPAVFKNFQRLLFYTRVHFDKSFHEGKWQVHKNGLCARSPKLRDDLTRLNNLHNKVVDALGRFREGDTTTGWTLIRRSFILIREAVDNSHHRQFSDILAILLLLQTRPFAKGIYSYMATHLFDFSRLLGPYDPLKVMFEFLESMPETSTATKHLYLAFDAFCRSLWKTHVGDNGIKSSWSYNQASFPRAHEGGFFTAFKGRRTADIMDELQQVDKDLGSYSSETFSMWHMAAEWFYRTNKFVEMETFLHLLSARINDLGDNFDFHQDPQLNLDCMKSFILLGTAQESLGDWGSALEAFTRAVDVRAKLGQGDRWDPGKLGALRKLEQLAMRFQDTAKAGDCQGQIDRIYDSQVVEDRQERAASAAEPRVD